MPAITKYTPEQPLYGILGDKDAYRQLIHQHDPELLSRYPSFHPEEGSSTGSHPPVPEKEHPSDTVKARRTRQRPSVVPTENEQPNQYLSPQQTGVTDMHSSPGNSWYDKDAEVWKPSKAANKSRRPLAPSRAPPVPPADYTPTFSPPPASALTMSEPAQPFARAMKPRKSALKSPNAGSRPPSDVSSRGPLQPAPLPPTAFLSPASAARRRVDLQRYGPGSAPPSALRPPSREAPSPYWMSPATSAGRLSSAAGSHRGSSAATSSVAFTSSSFSNSYSQSNSNSASHYAPDTDGEPDESPAPRQTLFVVNADPDSASERSVPVPQITRSPPPQATKPALIRRHQKAASAPTGVPPVPAVPPQFSAPPPPSFAPPTPSDRSRSVPLVPATTGERDRNVLRRHASDNSKSLYPSHPIPIPPPKSHSSGAGSLTHSDSTGSSSSSGRSGSPRTPPTQTSPSTSAEADIPQEWVHPLPLTLEQLFKGGKHEFRITRHMLNGSTKDQVVLVDVQPGWKSGTRITFPAAGNERAPGKYQDVIFVVEQVHHDRFARLEGGRLVVNEEIDLPEALNAGRKLRVRKIVGLDGNVIEFVAPTCVIRNGLETVVKGQGMYLRSKSQVKGRGDLVIRWNVRVPDNLTPTQYDQMRDIFAK